MPNAGWQAWRKAALPSGNRRSNFFTATHNLRFYERFNVMKTTTKLIGILLVFGLLTLVAGSASAQLKVQFDENGNGLNLSTGVPLQFGMATDQASGLTTLMYRLPFPLVTPGDLILTESSGAVSDVIRFENDPVSGVAYFFSDPADESPAPMADSPLFPPPNSAFPQVAVLETGLEGNDGAAYLAAAGSPGAAGLPGNSFAVFYNVISDSPVPEPSTLVLVSMSVIGILCYTWRKRKEN